MHTVAWTHRTFRKDVAVGIPVVAGIGVDQTTDSAVFSGNLRFDPPPGPAVLRDHDGALHRYAVALQLLIVRWHAVIHKDERAGYVAVDRVRVVRRQLFVVLTGGWVAGDARFLQFGLERDRRDKFHDALLRSWKEHIEVLDLRLPAEGAELIANPFGIRAIIRRPDVVRSRGESLHHAPQPSGLWDGAELCLPLALDARGLGRETTKGIGTRGERSEREAAEGKQEGDYVRSHRLFSRVVLRVVRTGEDGYASSPQQTRGGSSSLR